MIIKFLFKTSLVKVFTIKTWLFFFTVPGMAASLNEAGYSDTNIDQLQTHLSGVVTTPSTLDHANDRFGNEDGNQQHAPFFRDSDQANDGILTIERIHLAWQRAKDANKRIMLVLGSDTCDRCALLERYVTDTSMSGRLESRYIVLGIDVENSDFSVAVGEGGLSQDQLPAILLLNTTHTFEETMRSQEVLAFLPEPYEPIYQWIENIIHYTDRSLASI